MTNTPRTRLLVGIVLVGLVAACAAASPTVRPISPTPRTSAPTISLTAPATGVGATSAPNRSFNPAQSGPPGSAGPSGMEGASPGFLTVIDNPFLPLTPGRTMAYTGTKDGHAATEVVETRADTKVIDGATCVVTEDRVSLAGTLVERTLTYYAQDDTGSVWSFGEDVQDLAPDGTVQATTSWRAGVDSAPPMLVMPGQPRAGDTFEHPYTSNDFQILSLAETQTVPAGSYSGVLQTKEWSPAEPDVVVHKYYASGVGLIRDVAVSGPYEEVVLASVAGP